MEYLKTIPDLLFFIMAGFAAVISIILFFHWRKYGMGGAVLAITEIIYLAVALLLLTTAFVSLS